MGRYKGKKDKAWEAVKRWCRRTYKHCYTCPEKNLSKYNAQAGHYQPVAISGSNNHLAWDPRFLRLQCGSCNGPGLGMQNVYRRNLVAEYGEEIVAEYDRKVHGKFVDPIKDWDAIIRKFDEL